MQHDETVPALHTLDELDAHLRDLDAAEALEDEFVRAASAETYLEVDLGTLPVDPSSAAYMAWQLALYERIAGRPYRVENEATFFDFENARKEPFPYSTRSPKTVGEYLLSYGHLIRTLNLHAGLRVLEVGSGFGALTSHLAAMAYRVTCIDISTELLSFVQQRTQDAPFPVRVICGDMATVPLVGEDAGPYDAIIFYESFHHCLDHAALLDRLPALLAPGGRVVLAAEPIYPSRTPIVPYPWGLRLDGLSLREIRRRGWLELGFTAEYITSLFLDRDWMLQRHQMGEHALSDLWLARPREPGERGRGKAVMDEPASAPIFGSIVGERDTSGGTLGIWGAHNGFLQFGPYLSLRAGLYEAIWTGRTGGPSAPDSSARFEVATDQGENVVASYTLELPRDAPSERIEELARLSFYVPADRDDVEARVYVENRADITLHRVRVEKVVV